MQSRKYCLSLSFATLVIATGAVSIAADKYTGPRPPKADVPYLVHADNLVETETGEAKEETRKDGRAYVIPGAKSPARTPLAEPIFLIRAEKLVPDKLALYALEATKNGGREVFFPNKPKRDSARPVHTIVTRLGDGLYRLEANEALENGEYALSPDGSNQVFAFQVY